MGMYSFEIVPVPTLAPTFEYDISVIASSDGSVTTNEVLQFTLNDTFTNATLTAPENTKASYENNIVTWEIGSLDVAAKDIPLVLNVTAEHPTALEEGAVIASAITNTFLNEQGEEIIENYEDFTFNPPANPSPCCEKCPTLVPVDFTGCEQSKTATVNAEIDSDGREIKVTIKLARVCKNKKIVVGVELFEGSPNPVRRALKVIQLTRTTVENGCAPVECDCLTFFIPGPICSEQHFFIKAQAHYYDSPPSTCSCTCPHILG